MVGSYRVNIDDNVLRAAKVGLINLPPGELLRALVHDVENIAGVYPLGDWLELFEELDIDFDAGADTVRILLWWLILEELTDLLGLRDVVDALESALAAANGAFALLALLAVTLYRRLDEADIEKGSHVPVIDLAVTGNDIEARAGIALVGVVPLGGMRIQDNRILATGKQAVVVDASPLAANPHLLAAVLRAFFEALVDQAGPLLTMEPATDAGSVGEGLRDATEAILALIPVWYRSIVRVLETDYRIEGNSLRTPFIAIETNLYEITVRANHVTQEQSVGGREKADLLGDLRGVEATAGIAVAVASGTPVHRAEWAMADAESLDGESFRRLDRCVEDETLSAALMASAEAADSGEPQAIAMALVGLREALGTFFGGPAIWVKAPGARIVDNHVLVPPDSDPETWGRGGILVEGEEPPVELFLLILIALLLRVEVSPLLLMTETLVDNNEVIGGHGHGIKIGGVFLPLPLPGLVVVDPDRRDGISLAGVITHVRVRDNQIRAMAGAGIYLDDDANAVGVEISGNDVRGCSANSELAQMGLVDVFGGIVADTFAFGMIRTNRVTGCGNSIVGPPVFAINAQRAISVSITGNEVIHRGANSGEEAAEAGVALTQIGGIRAAWVMGDVAVDDNEVLVMGVGRGVYLEGLDPELAGKLPLPPALAVNVALYLQLLGTAAPVPTFTGASGVAVTVGSTSSFTTARVQQNRVTMAAGSATIGVDINAVRDLVMTGNTIRPAGAKRVDALVSGFVAQAVVGNNLVDCLSIQWIGEGTVTGNRASTGMIIQGGSAVIGHNSV
jgi:hypothetical protein